SPGSVIVGVTDDLNPAHRLVSLAVAGERVMSKRLNLAALGLRKAFQHVAVPGEAANCLAIGGRLFSARDEMGLARTVRWRERFHHRRIPPLPSYASPTIEVTGMCYLTGKSYDARD